MKKPTRNSPALHLSQNYCAAMLESSPTMIILLEHAVKMLQVARFSEEFLLYTRIVYTECNTQKTESLFSVCLRLKCDPILVRLTPTSYEDNLSHKLI